LARDTLGKDIYLVGEIVAGETEVNIVQNH